MKSLPAVPALAEPVEAYELSDQITGCDPAAKPGVVAFKDFILGTVGVGSSAGIVRDCGVGKPSYHHLGRAWDWSVAVSSAEESNAAQAVLDWLLATDPSGNEHAMYRRSGLVYMIWNRQIWTSKTKKWSAYTGADAHTDHIHFSFGEPGAMARTSFYRWLGVEPVTPPGPGPLPIVPMQGSNLLAGIMGLALGAGLGYILGTKMAQSRTRIGGGMRSAARRV